MLKDYAIIPNFSEAIIGEKESRVNLWGRVWTMDPNKIVTSSQECYSLVKIHFSFLSGPSLWEMCVCILTTTYFSHLWNAAHFGACRTLGCSLLRKQSRYVLIIAGLIYASISRCSLHVLTHIILTRTLCGESYYYHPQLAGVKIVA